MEGEVVFLDVTVTSPANLPCFANTTPETHINLAYKRKIKKWNADGCPTTSRGLKFMPLAVSVYGVWHEESLSFLKYWATCAAGTLNQDPATALSCLMARLSAALWKGNGDMLTWSPLTSDAQLQSREGGIMQAAAA